MWSGKQETSGKLVLETSPSLVKFVYIVVQFYTGFKFYFPLFKTHNALPYKNKTKRKIKIKHTHKTNKQANETNKGK